MSTTPNADQSCQGLNLPISDETIRLMEQIESVSNWSFGDQIDAVTRHFHADE